MRLELATAEYIGARAQQQDMAAAVHMPNGALLILADGLGGHESGAEAARLVVETFREAAAGGLFEAPSGRRQALLDTVERANARIGEGVDPAHGHRGMASTAVAAVVAEGELSWVSVGDSHLYVWRGGRLAKLNEDHSQAGLLVKSGNYKPDDPEVLAVRSVLVSALTGRKLDIVDLPQRTFKVESGDVLMLASDGLNTLDDDEIGRIVAAQQGEGAVRLSTVLLETVRSRRVERQDNTTVAVARVLETVDRSARADAARERTVTHQVTVPGEVSVAARAARSLPAADRASPTPASAPAVGPSIPPIAASELPTVPLTRPASPRVAEAMAAAARGVEPATAPTDDPGEATAAPTDERAEAPQPVASSGRPLALPDAASRTDPSPEQAKAQTKAEATASPEAAAPPSADRRPHRGPDNRGTAQPAAGARAPTPGTPRRRSSRGQPPRSGFARAALGAVLIWLALGLAAIGAVAALRPGWLGDWLPRITRGDPSEADGADAKGNATGKAPRTPAATQPDTPPAAARETEQPTAPQPTDAPQPAGSAPSPAPAPGVTEAPARSGAASGETPPAADGSSPAAPQASSPAARGEAGAAAPETAPQATATEPATGTAPAPKAREASGGEPALVEQPKEVPRLTKGREPVN